MTVNKENGRVYVKLPKTIIIEIDKEAKKEIKSRSSVLAKIIINHYQEVEGE